ncbi:MAG: pilus assembly protein PilM [Candidatus Hydrogenedentes bacterium]|nr:pilus assembly protein PilM [Candidatus Hydrogenedentota bacterium]
MARKSGNISILQIGEHLISRLRVRPSLRGVEVLDFAQERGTWALQDGSLQSALTAFAHQHRLVEDAVYVVLPRHEVAARIVTFPSHDLTEIKGMVRLSAEEYVPYPAEELVIDECILEKLHGGEARVLVVLAHRDVVEGYVRLLRQAGLEPQEILVSTACLASAMAATGVLRKDAIPPQQTDVSLVVPAARETEPRRAALVHLLPGGIEILIFRGNHLEAVRGVANAQDWMRDSIQSAAAIGELASEVRGALASFRRELEESTTIESLLVSSDVADATEWAKALEPEAGLLCSSVPAMGTLVTRGQEHLANAQPLALLGAACVAQARAAVPISLVPESVLHARQRLALRRIARRGALLVGAVLVAWFGLFFQAVAKRAHYAHELEDRHHSIAQDARGVAEKHRQLQAISRQVDRKGTAVELLARLCEVAPSSGLNITRVVFVRGQGVTVEGRALDVSAVDQFAENLRQSGRERVPQFAQARTISTQGQTEQNQGVTQFEISVPFPQIEESEQAEAAVE